MAAKSKLLQRVIGLLVLCALLLVPAKAHAQSSNDCTYVYYAHTYGLIDGLKVGDHVTKGQLIGHSGNTGYGSGWTPSNPVTVPHLHFGCSTLDPVAQEADLKAWTWVDPDPKLHPGWGNPLDKMVETGVPFGVYNSAGGQARHTGRDYRASVNTPLYAVADGTIVWASWWPANYAANKTGNGIAIVIQLGEPSTQVTHATEDDSTPVQPNKVKIRWIPSLTEDERALWIIVVLLPGILFVLLFGLSFLYGRLPSMFGQQKKKKRRRGDASVSAEDWRAQKEELKRYRSLRRKVMMVMLALTGVGISYMVTIFLYQPVWPRGETLQVTLPDANTSATVPSQVLPEIAKPAPSTDVSAIWDTIALESGYKNAMLLREFCVDYGYPRGPDGKFLPADQGGKIFPCEYAAGVTKGETNTDVWLNADPRKPGPWGNFLGWQIAPSYFTMSASELLAGRSMSSMAEACRVGLEVVANNAIVQAKYPGLTAQTMYTSKGCSIGRGQTLGVHFRPGALLGDLENMDVWGSDGPAVEAIYRHLVTRGCNGSWYKTGNVQSARCGYNPGAWGDPSAQWYWDAWQQQADAIRIAINAHQAELAAASQSTLTVVPIPAEKTEELPDVLKSVVTIQTDRPTVGSGVYAAYDTPFSLVYRFVNFMIDESVKTDDQDTLELYTSIKEFMDGIASRVYSLETRINLGFDTQEVLEVQIDVSK